MENGTKKGQETVLTVQMTQSRPERSNAQVAAGAVLLAVGLIGLLAVPVLPWGIGQGILFLAVPMAICGILCLTLRKNAGLACVAVVLLTIALWVLIPLIFSIISYIRPLEIT